MGGEWIMAAIPYRGVRRVFLPDEETQRRLDEEAQQAARGERLQEMRLGMERAWPSGHPDAGAIVYGPEGVPTRQPIRAGADLAASLLSRFGRTGGDR